MCIVPCDTALHPLHSLHQAIPSLRAHPSESRAFYCNPKKVHRLPLHIVQAVIWGGFSACSVLLTTWSHTVPLVTGNVWPRVLGSCTDPPYLALQLVVEASSLLLRGNSRRVSLLPADECVPLMYSIFKEDTSE